MAMSAAVVMTHQITPLALIGLLAVLVITGGVRPRWLPLFVVAMVIGWAYLARDFVASQPGLVSVSGSRTPSASIIREAEYWQSALMVKISTGMTAVVWLAAGVGALVGLRRKWLDLRLVALFCAPFALLVTPYGGEASLRTVLFTLPSAAVLASLWLFGRRGRLTRRVVGGVAATLMAVGCVISTHGRDQIHRPSRAELALEAWVFENTEPDSLIAFFNDRFPSRSHPDYPAHQPGTWQLSLTESPLLNAKEFTIADAIAAADADLKFGTRTVYIVLSDLQERSAETYGSLPPDRLRTVTPTMLASGRYKQVYSNEAGSVFKVLQK